MTVSAFPRYSCLVAVIICNRLSHSSTNMVSCPKCSSNLSYSRFYKVVFKIRLIVKFQSIILHKKYPKNLMG